MSIIISKKSIFMKVMKNFPFLKEKTKEQNPWINKICKIVIILCRKLNLWSIFYQLHETGAKVLTS